MLKICLAGTGGMKPLPERFLTGLWAEHIGKALLIDCGEGMQTALAKHKCKVSRLDALLITHLHADHIAGLPGLLLTVGNNSKQTPLKIYGPTGTAGTVEKLRCICPEVAYDIIVTELPVDRISSFEWNGISVSAMPVRHAVSCLCYSLTENRPVIFDPVKARKLNIPQNLWNKLHYGGECTVDGRRFTADEVSSGTRPPLKITYITDTEYFPQLEEFAADSDLLVCEGMYGSDEYIPKMQEKQHMVFSQAAHIAKTSRSQKLWLTHYSPAMKSPEDYTESVRGIFENTVVCTDGITAEFR